jgi:general secretion pathway protein A
MYLSFFGLSEKPFAITPDPRYLYLSERHAEALAHLLYGINESGGFVQLTGEVGTGKTTVVRTLLSRVPHHADVAVILNPRVTPVEFLLTICEELGLPIEAKDRDSVKQMVDALNRRLLSAHAEGRRVIVIVDEAQNLSAETLEQVRLLTNLETPTQKLLQIILIGQPELRDLLDRNDLRQLAQRITGRYHLKPLSREETQGYVRHRLRVAGATGEIFTPGALRELHRLSSGIPRVINVSCDRALLGAYTQEARKVSARLVRRAAGEVYGRRFVPVWLGWATGAALAASVAGLGIIGFRTWQHQSTALRTPHPTPAAAAASARAAAGAAASGLAVAAKPAPVPVSLNGLLTANSANTSDSAAFRRLLSLWGLAMTDDRDPCGQAQRAGLVCLEQRGSWTQVRTLNRPAILSLTDDAGQKHRVVLTALDDKFATLLLSEHDQRVPIEDVSRDWFGDFTIVWKPKTSRTRELSVGMHGDEVRWLRRSLAALHGASSDPAHDDLYDEELAIAVQNFQREHRLNVDGIAGLQTQVVLDTALAEPGSPLLLQTVPHS